MKKIGVAVLGGGRIGKIHTENIIRYIPQAAIVTVADIFSQQLTDWAKSIGVNNLTKDPEKAINDPNVDAVFICSPTDTHSNYIIKAAKAGKDIFCEKPVDLNIAKIKEAMAVVEKSKVKLQIGFQRRFDHNFKKIHDIIKQGKIGDINMIKLTSWDPEPPTIEYLKVSGGIFLDMTIHDFDMARFIAGCEVTEVFANAAVRIDPNIGIICSDYDTAITSLKFENGAIGVIDNCRKAMHGYDQRAEVLGSSGAVAILNDKPSTTIFSADNGICSEKPLRFFTERYSIAYIEEIKEFFNAIKDNRQPSVGINDGLKAIEIGVAALRSAKEKRVVKIEEII